MENKQLQEARTNPDFLKYLEETRIDSIKEKNISKMYETLDSMLVLDLEEEKINELYTNILKVSFEKIDFLLKEKKKLTLEKEEFLYARALYEFGIENWSNDNFKKAKEIFFILSRIIEDKLLIESLNIILIILENKKNFDIFYETLTDLGKTNEKEIYNYFIVNFKFNNKNFINDNKNLLEKIEKNLNYLLEE